MKRNIALLLLLLTLPLAAQRHTPRDFNLSYVFAQSGAKDMDEMEDSIRQMMAAYAFSTPDSHVNALARLMAVADQRRPGMTRLDWMRQLLGDVGRDALSTSYLAAQYATNRGPRRQEALQVLDGQLWMEEQGHWGEFKDRQGLQRLHEHASVRTTCAPIVAEACSPLQAYRASRYIDRQEVMPADQALVALAHFKAGRNQQGWQSWQQAMKSQIYDGASPVDSLNRLRLALTEGLLGMQVSEDGKRLILRPGFPADWREVAVHTPQLDYRYQVKGDVVEMDVTQHTRQPLQVVLRINLGGGAYRDVEGSAQRHQVLRTPCPVRLPEAHTYDSYASLPPEVPGMDEPLFDRPFKTIRMERVLTDSIPYDIQPEFLLKDEYVVQGVPFRVPLMGNNITFVQYPDTLWMPLSGKAEQLWLLMAGTTNDRERHISNAVVVAHYEDGTHDSLSLVNPDNWSPLATGRARRLCLRLDETKKLVALEIRPESAEIKIGLMGVTLQ